jgi:hypothetical protein
MRLKKNRLDDIDYFISQMENQLIDPNFSVTAFLEKHLEGSEQTDDIDLQLTDLIFTLNMIQNESQEKIYAA